MIADDWKEGLHAYLAGTARGLRADSLAVGGVADHVHLLIRPDSTRSIADIVREVKKSSSKWAAERYARFAWQSGYGAFSISADRVEGTIRYIHNQSEHHKTISSADEMRALLAEFGVAYDERYFG